MRTKLADGVGSKHFYKTVAALVIPMALQNLINVGVQSADVFMLGLVSEEVLSAASLAGQVQFVMTLFFFGLSSGAMVLTAQYWGKGDMRAIEKVLAITMRISAGVALAFFLAAELMPQHLMRVFTPNAELVQMGVQYLRVVAPSYLFMAFTNIYLNIMRSVEKVVVATIVYFISLLCNVAFNAVLIFGLLGFPAMGITGAALGTTAARFVEVIIVGIYAARNKVLRLRPADLVRRHRTLTKDFIKYAAPTTINELLWGLAMSTMAVIIGRLGTAAVAANSVAQVVRQLATVVSFGVANAAAIMVGKAIGAGDAPRAETTAARLIRVSLITGVLGSVLVLVIRPLVVSVMSLSPAAADVLQFLLLWIAAYVMGQALSTTMVVGIFRGGGDTRFGLFMDFAVMWGGSILWGALGAFVFKLPVKVVFMILLCDEFIKIPIVIARYKSRRWLRNVTRTVTD